MPGTPSEHFGPEPSRQVEGVAACPVAPGAGLAALALSPLRAAAGSTVLAAAVEQAAEAIVITDAGGLIEYANPAFTQMTGYSVAEVVGRNPRFLKSGRQSPEFYRDLWRAILAGTIWHGELLNRRKDGSTYLEEMSITPVRDASGATTNFIAIKQDVTERRRAEEENAFLAAIVSSSEDAIVGKDLDGLIASWNLGAERLYGYRAEEIIGKPVSTLAPPDRRAEMARILERIRQGEKVTGLETVRARRDGSLMDVSLTAFPIKNQAGEAVGAAAIVHDITARTRAEAAQRKSAAEFKAAFEDAPIGMCLSGVDKKLLRVNQALCRLLGYSEQELLAKGWEELTHPDDLERSRRAADEMRRCGAPAAEFDKRYIHKRGNVIWVRMKIAAVRDGGGEPSYFITHVEDITERTRAEQALQASEARYRSLLSNLPDVVWTLDSTGHFTFMSPNVEDLSGYTVKEIDQGGASLFLSRVHPDDAAMVREALVGFIARGEPFDGECRVQHKNGGWLWVHNRAVATYDSNGVLHADGLLADVTARKRIEEALRLTQLSVDRASDAVLWTDADGRFLYANEAACSSLGWSRDEFLTLRVPDIDLNVTAEVWVQSWAGMKAKGSVILETRLRARDGRVIPVEITANYQALGAKEYCFAIVHDVTRREQTELELRRAKEEAEHANRAKSEFLANMSHEIRTPMNGIIGMTELALDTDLTAEQREYLTMVRTSAESLLRVINDILDFSKIEAGKLEVDSIDFDPIRCVEDAARSVALPAHEKGLELLCDFDPAIPAAVRGDPARLRQVVVNLLGNAVKFTSQGEVAVQVTLASRAADGLWLHFIVSDTGIGIAADKLSAIFAPFAQADTSMTRKYGGTGLGLTICARLVQIMNGKIWVESEPGQGSRFHFTARFGESRAAPACDAPQSVGLGGLRVLVVDDNATNRKMLHGVLARWGMRPDCSENGEAALAALGGASRAGEAFRLVLTDAHMPVMDGFKLAERIRKNPALAGAAIMMLTSSGQRGDAARCRELGVAAYLVKPIRQAELRQAIVSVLGRGLEKSRPTNSGVDGAPPRPRRIRILLAEDNPVNQALVSRLLGKRGHRVVVARNGREALDTLARERFDLALMDAQMPVMDGFETTAAIREKEKRTGGHLPIIALTAYALKGDRERFLKAGMDGYLSKPIRAPELIRLIEALNLEGEASARRDGAEGAAERGEAPDFADARTRVDGDDAVLGEMAALFIADCPGRLSAIHKAIAEGDAKALSVNAHALKGAVLNFVKGPAFEAAQRLEAMGRAGDLSGAGNAWASLLLALKQLEPGLQKLAARADGAWWQENPNPTAMRPSCDEHRAEACGPEDATTVFEPHPGPVRSRA